MALRYPRVLGSVASMLWPMRCRILVPYTGIEGDVDNRPRNTGEGPIKESPQFCFSNAYRRSYLAPSIRSARRFNGLPLTSCLAVKEYSGAALSVYIGARYTTILMIWKWKNRKRPFEPFECDCVPRSGIKSMLA